jgi:hypothetical protein
VELCNGTTTDAHPQLFDYTRHSYPHHAATLPACAGIAGAPMNAQVFMDVNWLDRQLSQDVAAKVRSNGVHCMTCWIAH